MNLCKHLLKLTHASEARQTFARPLLIKSGVKILLLTYLISIFTLVSEVSATNSESAKLIPCSLVNSSMAKGQWYPMDSHIKRTSVSVLAPGLNLKPSKLNSIASYLSEHGSEAFIIDFDLPESNPREIAHYALCMAQKRAQQLGVEKIHAIGHSLGGLALLDTQNSHYRVLPYSITLLAPSLFERFVPSLIGLIDWIPFGSLPSLNLSDYRINSSTSLKSYRALHLMREHFFTHIKEIENWPKIEVFMSENDELLDFEKTKNFCDEKHWGFHKLTPNSTNEKTISHLIVDPPSMGKESFQFFTDQLGKVIN